MTVLVLIFGSIGLISWLSASVGYTASQFIGPAVILLLVAALLYVQLGLTRSGHLRDFPPGQSLDRTAGQIQHRRAKFLGNTLQIDWLARALHRGGHAGLTVRIARRGELLPIEPLAVPFEPMLISEGDPNFDALVPENVRLAAAGPPRAGRPVRPAAPAAESHWYRYFIQRNGWVMAALFGFVALINGIEALQRRTLTPGFLLWSLLFLTSLVPFRRQMLAGAGQYFIVPGGLLSRRARLTLFRRAESVLIALSASRTVWRVAIFDGRALLPLAVTERELAVLLRAWLSPLTPPSVDQLSDLAT